jgi:hypothetical protein
VKTKFTLLLWTLILCACSTGISSPQTSPTQTATEVSSSLVLTPTSDFSSSQCGWQWTYEELPELSALFDDAVKVSIPNSSSRATAYGENCLDNDGQIVYFLTMETDFHVTVPVETLDDYDSFGNWMAQVMQVVDGLPSNHIEGPQPGFVEFRFENGNSEFIIVRVPIQGYDETANGKTGEELFRMFYRE